MSAKKHWWKTAFDKKYLDTFIDTHSPASTENQVRFLVRAMKPLKNKEILDLACGFGRHAIPLAKMGYKITGVDYSKYLLNKARREARKQEVRIEFLRKDMRELKFRNRFDAVYCMFTSFGYFVSQKEHLKTLKNIAVSLKKDGVFLLDLPNLFEVETRTKKYKENKNGAFSRTFREELSNDLEIKIKSTYNSQEKIISMRVEWLDECESEKSYETRIYLFSREELTKMLKSVGLKVKTVFGDYNGKKYSRGSHRMLVLSQKEKRPI